MYNKVEIRRFFCAKKSARVAFNQCSGASIENIITSLDASTACDVMKILKDLSKNGCTIVFSIHQPRTATALEPFIKERALFIHENVSGYYSMSTLFFAKLLCDLVPMRVVPSGSPKVLSPMFKSL
ncbi:unnamed protein product [Rotaria sordida]|uniref:ABC transporter family G domain-containing protein n=1 Tax=Rotaria sordida TaxID=392033 RepID=A0A814MG83_9BILA|nr:unnamed protein product [Rotaria sordida]